MKTCGIVVEYNPFHNGHRYHIQAAKEKTGAEYMIAVMSGNFLQRGEPALVSKFYRAKMALLGGADIVVELPYAFSTQKADDFARGAVEILHALGCERICFGSESGHIDAFRNTLDFLKEKEAEYNELVKQYMAEGVSYPKASALAFSNLPSPKANVIDLSKPNNILGYHYLKAIDHLGITMVGETIRRIGSGYHDENLSSERISSATGIRKQLFADEQSLDSIRGQVPETTYFLLEEYREKFGTFARWENYWPFLKFRILQSTPEELKEIYEMEEGLENRIISAALYADGFQTFMERLKTKRYTWTRLQRVLTHVLTNTKKDEMKEASKKARYIRLLGANRKGRNYLRKKKEELTLPLISKLSGAPEALLKLDIRAGQIYSFGYPEPVREQLMKMDFQQPPVILE